MAVNNIQIRNADGAWENAVVPAANGGTGRTDGKAAGVTGTIAVANGGTGGTTVAAARNNLGLGNTSGAVPVANGGTAKTTVSGYCQSLFPNSKLPTYIAGFGANWADGAYITPASLMGTYIKMGTGAAPATQTAGSIYIQYT